MSMKMGSKDDLWSCFAHWYASIFRPVDLPLFAILARTSRWF
jgi:hypothetical protein